MTAVVTDSLISSERTRSDATVVSREPSPSLLKPRLGFLGVGWIGRNRMEAMARSGLAEMVGIADAVEANASEAAKLAPRAERFESLKELLALELDGVVIATPSALHAEQAVAALEKGLAVFCQKPLARTKAETQRVIDAARANDRLLDVDLSYRFTSGVQAMRRVVQSGELGKIFAADLVFHNAYGPDKAWFYDYKLAGGGCVMDLGIHLVDLALWVMDADARQRVPTGVATRCRAPGHCVVEHVSARLFAKGESVASGVVEDYGLAHLDLADGVSLNIACSWKLQAGCDAIIRAAFYGTNGGVEFRNVNGSFYEFCAERFFGTRRETLASGTEEWGGRAGVDWLRRLSAGKRYDPQVEGLLEVAGTLDRIYGRA